MPSRDSVSAAAALAALEGRVARPVTRFAPAPTGYLHLGHVVNAIFVWGLARALGGTVILRIEDHDRQRSRREYEAALLEDLEWLGFEADVHPSADYRRGACEGRQSQRDAIYLAALQPLIEAGLVYGCRCSRADIERVHAGRTGREDGHGRVNGAADLRYPNTCRDAGLPPADGVGWRLRLDPGMERFEDALCGPQAQDPAAQCGDLLLRDRLGNWTYQCAATVDDFVQGVSLVIRGLDLLPSTGRQIRLARVLGRTAPPVYAHHPLVMKSPAQKLSKSNGDTGVRDLRSVGQSAAEIIGRAAHLAGLVDHVTPIEAAEVARLFR